MVAGMTDELYDALIPNITIYGSMGININYAAKNILMSLDPVQFTEERVGKLMAARSDPNRGPFKDDKDFLSYCETLGIRDTWYKDDKGQPKVLLLFDSEYNFRVRATGMSGKVSKDIVAIVYDFNRVKSRLKTLNDQMKPAVAPTPAEPGAPAPAATPSSNGCEKGYGYRSERTTQYCLLERDLSQSKLVETNINSKSHWAKDGLKDVLSEDLRRRSRKL